MQNIVWKVVLTLFVLALCLYSVYPPEQKVKLGKDLQGGTSLIYLVNIPENAPDSQQVLAQIIEVLKRRVNPEGVLDISMMPLGNDRIEIVMPLPSERVQELRRQYEDALEELLAQAEIPEAELDEALRFNRAVEKFGGGASGTDAAGGRSEQIAALQKAYNDLEAARRARAEAQSSGVTGPDLFALESAEAAAQITYDDLREQVLKSSLDQARVVRTLNLPTTREPRRDPVTGKIVVDERGQPIQEESQRDSAVADLKAEFPHLAAQLDQTIAAYDEYQRNRTTLDDPEDLIRMLRGAGVLEFHIVVRHGQPEGVNIEEMRTQLKELGPDNTTSSVARWYPINELKQWYDTPQERELLEADPVNFFAARGLVAERHEGKYYLLLYTTKAKSMTHGPNSRWTVESTGIQPDQLGRPAVEFQLDPAGGAMMAKLSGAHVGQQMAIVLDDQVYSAARLQSQINNNGIITGDFSQSELEYLTRTLAAGALEAQLSPEPIAMHTLGPSLGKDNLYRGLEACVLSVIVTAAIMLGYYFFAGMIANVALLLNAIMIFGMMAMIDGTFTLPGLAGIALSVAMAVDANVLIYERIREELVNNKEDLRTAIRLGYSRALSAIIDGNLTNLIVGIVLYYTATTEVKGFALTMILGIGATLFTALFVTRLLYTFYTEYFKIRTLPMLPTVFPGIHRALEPSINWISMRGVFLTVSIITSVASLALVFARGSDMLDTEFRGGLSMTIQTRMANPGEPAGVDGRLLLSRPDVEQIIQGIGEQAGPSNDILYQLRNASVLTVGEVNKDFQSSRFQIKVSSPSTVKEEATINETVERAIVQHMGDKLDVIPDLVFKGAGSIDHTPYTYRIDDDVLGPVIDRPEYPQSVRSFRGGVAVLVEDIEPAVTPQAAKERIDRIRQKPDFSRARARETRVIGLEPVDPTNPDRGYRSIAVLVADPLLRTADFDHWDRELAAMEWNLVATALANGSSFQELSSFSPAVAATLAAKASVAVILSLIGMLVYIWVRFGSLRYSLSAIAALAHNVIICLGALALTHLLAGTTVASWLLLDEFRIDLNVIAALLTIIGYSLNDTIVILDRIRENRGKRPTATPEIINNSINQTFSRTVLTGGSTILASVILYVLGGTGIQPFAFTFLIGLLIGTYSSVAIAAPLVAQPPEQPGGAYASARRPARASTADAAGTVASAPA